MEVHTQIRLPNDPIVLQRIGRYIRKGGFCFIILLLLILVLMAIVPNMWVRFSPLAIDPGHTLQPPSLRHFLGTDEYGRDIWARIVFGARTTIGIGIGSALLAAVIGVPLGLVSGFYRGGTDTTVLTVVDTMMSFPAMLLAILIVSAWGANPLSLIVVISLVNFSRYTLIVRSNVLSLREREYILAARLSGLSSWKIIVYEILPNCSTPIVVQGSLLMASAVLIESGLSYFGLGIQPPKPSWGAMLSDAQNYLSQAPWYSIAPGVAIMVTVLGINVVGDYLHDRLNARRQTRGEGFGGS